MRERDLLQHVYDTSSSGAPHVVIGPGDDMAMVRLDDASLLAAVDQLVDGRHVDLARTSLALAGRKAITRCLSDVAAMAARPVASLVAVTLPPDFGEERARALFDAMHATALAYDAPLVGGDIAMHDAAGHPLTCAVTVLATPGPVPPRRRGDARAGDGVYVTGRLGGAVEADGGGRHLTFEPRLAEAIALATAVGDRLHAMIDVSDGLGRDASHVASASGVAIEIDASLIPRAEGVDWRRAASEGEDYELLFTASGAVPETLPGGTSGGAAVPVTRVGEVTARSGDDAPLVVVRDGRDAIRGDDLGWEHVS
jgi:thiamine-monophosphate kinase